MTTFERLVTYVQQFDPQFPEAIAGASPQQIAELEALMGGPAPEIYRDFLRVMGRGMDWITIRRMDLRIETVLAHYRRENWLPRHQFIRIGVENEEPRLHPHLEIDLPNAEPAVVCFPACRPQEFEEVISTSLEPLAGSLQELIAMPVFKMFELRPHGRVPVSLKTREWKREALADLERVVSALGFEKRWFSSHSGHAYRREDAAVRANQHLGYPLQVFVSANSDPAREQVVKTLLREVKELARVG